MGTPDSNVSLQEGWRIELTPRQLEIIELVKKHAPVTGEQIAESLGVSRPTIRSDLSILIMLGHLDAKPKVGYFLGKVHTAEGKLKDKLVHLKVKDRMSRPFVIGEQETVNDAVIALFMENTGMLTVTDAQGQLAGVVSLKDLLKVALGNPTAASIPISMVMTRLPRVVSVHPDDTIWEAAKKMLEHQVGGLPVVRSVEGAEGRSRLEVVGRITKTSLAQVLVDLSSEL
ncbi:helix-turn-helix transcriptional regulator [Cohnella caldifontis]|uniref:helix-turn-helix transcriptional regulator n=1 Tax=Cohnella caldifontis TaxID=3027471 RepID=UPI0030DA24C6